MVDAQAVLHDANEAWLKVEEQVTTLIGRRHFDEVALWTPDAWRAAELIKEMMYQPEDGARRSAVHPWQRPRFFNRSSDTVHFSSANREGGAYGVHYDFLQPFGTDYRLEVMHLLTGSSPAHHMFFLNWLSGNPDETAAQVVHVSYKPVINLGESVMRAYDRELLRLAEVGFVPVQSNRSTYGAFAYYEHLKPRVNLRDAALA
jgi:hypothetical protein